MSSEAMSSEVVIRAEQAGKAYRLYPRPIDRLWQLVWGRHRKLYQDFTALQDISFELVRGEVMGIVGVNGAGKSTLLQLIAGTITATQGTVTTRGRVAALLELGSGFNPEFSGRENIYLNAAILGLQKSEIDARIDEIVRFADIGVHIDQPVKTYSSGMYTRLAFSIATSVDPDVLIIDEALSVGDGAFARRSFDRVMDIKKRGATVLFCSHTLFHIEVFCDRALWLHQGKAQALGPVSQVLSRYQEFLDDLSAPVATAPTVTAVDTQPADSPATHAPVPGDAAPALESVLTPAPAPAPAASGLSHPSGHARITAVQVQLDGHHGQELYGVSGASCLQMQIHFASDPALPAPSAALVISSDGGRILATNICASQGLTLQRDGHGQGVAQIVVDKLPLNKGRYRVGAYLMCENGIHVYQWIDPVAHIQLHREGYDQGYWVLPGVWSSAEPGAS